MAKILIADDEVMVQELWRMVLEAANHQVLVVDSGSQVIPTLRKEKPDLLILDVMLPGLDGLSVQKAISADPELQRLPVIVATANRHFMKLFDNFKQIVGRIDKPAKNEALVAAVEAALSSKKP